MCKAATTPEAQERFRREAQAAAALNHPNLCPIYDFDQHDGIAYIAMAFIEGSPLGEWVQQHAPDQRQSAWLVAKLALAMQEAHDNAVIHRDLKPDNVAINKKGEPIILDFGLARQLDDSRTRLSHAGQILGTPSYMAPEQALGDSTTVNHAADIYSLGVIFYELLTGTVPFRGSLMSVLGQHMNAAPEPPRKRKPGVDPALEAICLTALAKQPAERHPSMGVFAQLLNQAAETLAKAPTPVVVPRLPPSQRRNRKPGEIETLDLGDGATIRFAWIPAGTFYMGGGGGTPGEQEVAIEEGFALGIYPVTHQQWQDVMGDNPSLFSMMGIGKDKVKGIPDADLKQFPVENVSWEQAQECIAKLNQRFSDTGWRYRLPTEAEWEYACRGAARSEADCSFHFYLDRPSNDLSSGQANFGGNYPDGNAAVGPDLERTTRVGSYQPNRLGLYDMHGNVWEWCEDLWEEGSGDRVIRGGSWSCDGQAAGRRSATERARRSGTSTWASVLPEFRWAVGKVEATVNACAVRSVVRHLHASPSRVQSLRFTPEPVHDQRRRDPSSEPVRPLRTHQATRLRRHGLRLAGRDTRLNRKVALKVCKAATTREAQERFRREAQAAAALNHPNLCPIYDFDEHDGVAYIAMAFIEGSPLSAWVQGRAPDQRQSDFLVAKLALAMQEAHEAGVIHRDLKPDNVTINKKGEPIVLDFGLARQMGDSRRRITHAGKVFGTPAYMAPEQAAGETQTIGPACDVYALGVMLYELLTGVRPFAGPPLVLLFNHINTPPVPPRQHTPSVDPALEAICLKALAKHPAERHPSMKVFAQLLDQAAKTLGKAPAPVVDSQPPLAPTLLTHTLPQGRVRNPGEIETLDLGGGVAIRFAWVPAGTFFMGGGGGKPGEQRVEIARGFALGIYPVTQEQWQTVMDNNPSSFAQGKPQG